MAGHRAGQTRERVDLLLMQDRLEFVLEALAETLLSMGHMISPDMRIAIRVHWRQATTSS